MYRSCGAKHCTCSALHLWREQLSNYALHRLTIFHMFFDAITPPLNATVVFDIDETSLSNYEAIKEQDFGCVRWRLVRCSN